jgi:hypothetical protein
MIKGSDRGNIIVVFWCDERAPKLGWYIRWVLMMHTHARDDVIGRASEPIVARAAICASHSGRGLQRRCCSYGQCWADLARIIRLALLAGLSHNVRARRRWSHHVAIPLLTSSYQPQPGNRVLYIEGFIHACGKLCIETSPGFHFIKNRMILVSYRWTWFCQL